MKKTTITRSAFFVALGFTAFILFSVVHNWQNKRHSVEFFSASHHEYYENAPATAQIQVSPQIAWQHVPIANKILGWVFLFALWFFIWFVDNDKHLGKLKVTDPGGNRQGLAIALIVAPLVLSFVMFFASYSSLFSSNYVTITREKFDGWLNKGVIEKKGERTYIDKSDSMELLFNKPFIR